MDKVGPTDVAPLSATRARPRRGELHGADDPWGWADSPRRRAAAKDDDHQPQVGAELRARVTEGIHAHARAKALADQQGITLAEWTRRAIRHEVLRQESEG